MHSTAGWQTHQGSAVCWQSTGPYNWHVQVAAPAAQQPTRPQHENPRPSSSGRVQGALAARVVVLLPQGLQQQQHSIQIRGCVSRWCAGSLWAQHMNCSQCLAVVLSASQAGYCYGMFNRLSLSNAHMPQTNLQAKHHSLTHQSCCSYPPLVAATAAACACCAS